MKRIVPRVVVGVAVALLLLLNLRLHRPGDIETTIAQLQYLEGALDEGAGEDMQRIFPEGYVFTWALYGLTAAQVARRLSVEDPRRRHHLSEAQKAVERVRSDDARSTFVREMVPPYGTFYASWSLYVLAEYVRAAGLENASPKLVVALREDCDDFAEALGQYSTPFMPSYPSSAWPADTAVGVAALGICNEVLGRQYDALIERWVSEARARLDRDLGALSHAADADSGAPRGGVRGSSLALMSRVLVDAAPDFSREQYVVLRDHFVDFSWGLPGVREYPRGDDSQGDVDSGPIILGFSGPAVVVGAAAAEIHGDPSVAGPLLGAVELVGVPVQVMGRRSYAGGRMPLGDAFIAWARSSPAPTGQYPPWTRVLPLWWSLPIHAGSLVICLLMLWAMRRFTRKRVEQIR